MIAAARIVVEADPGGRTAHSRLDLPSPEAAWRLVGCSGRACGSTSSAWSCSWRAATSS